MLQNLTREALAESVNTPFRVNPQSADAFEIVLIEFKPGKSIPSQEQFSLLFRAPLEAPAQQGIFQVQHDSVGEFELFLVPVRKDAQGLYYEAVFNRLID